MEFIRLMTDYQCFPLWKIGDKTVENISPDELPISKNLKEKLFAWQKKYDETLNMDDPTASGFKTSAEKESFEEDGLIIWKLLLEEIGNFYNIKYYSRRDHILYDSPIKQ